MNSPVTPVVGCLTFPGEGYQVHEARDLIGHTRAVAQQCHWSGRPGHGCEVGGAVAVRGVIMVSCDAQGPGRPVLGQGGKAA
jgi:hypothetical protein